MSALGIMLAAIVIVVLVSALAMFRLRSDVYLQMMHDLERGNPEAVLARADGRAARMLVSPYARGIACFKAYALSHDRQRMADQFNVLMKLPLNEFNRVSLLTDGFAAFARMRDRKRCERILKEMEASHVNVTSLEGYRQFFEIVLAGRVDQRERIEDQIANLNGHRLGYAEYLLACIYASIGDGRVLALRSRAALHLEMQVDQLDGGVGVGTAI
ncbi:hypothetical protein Corgl_1677 [Coriobacterium glomerans PW2]|uniref:Uncharacterized protein n=1 Tax=Coriobacterium glomerans (strain ATCC 49209 / DSM 20642 / JCM 10262 / PW2) TaxID=700015 RepID=F2NB24_CORGP|nr:hypothetical protein [Coriobacterium glomerans]AEB07775.1 hypothetical protein Corgl_1677 [Coriobacterium glomerans PW2]